MYISGHAIKLARNGPRREIPLLLAILPLFLLLAPLTLTTRTRAAAAPGPVDTPILAIRSQPFAIMPNTDVTVRLGIRGATAMTDTVLVFSLAGPVVNRAAVASISRGEDAPRYRQVGMYAVSELSNLDGELVVQFQAVSGSSISSGAGTESGRRLVTLPGDGSYSARFELKNASDPGAQPIASTWTWFAYMSRLAENPLRIGLVWPISTHNPGRSATGSPTDEFLNAIQPGGLLAEAISVASASQLPLSLEVVPETLSDLVSAATDPGVDPLDRDRAVALLDQIRFTSRRSRNIAILTPYAKPPSSLYSDRTFAKDVENQYRIGAAVTQELLGVSAITDLAVAPGGPLDETVVERVLDFGANRMLLEDDRLEPMSGSRRGGYSTQPFLLGAGAAPITAVAIDSGLSELLRQPSTASLTSPTYQALAEIMSIYLEAPHLTRTIVIAPDFATTTTLPPMEHFLSALASLPAVRVQTVDKVFDEVPLATGARRAPILRETTKEKPPPVPAGTLFASVHRELEGFQSIMAQPNPLPDLFYERILAAQGSGPLENGGEGARLLLDSVARQIGDELQAIGIPASSGITLTSRDSVVPIRIENKNDYPVRVALWLDSEHVRFPDHVDGEPFVLVPPGETRDVKVLASTTGAFTIRVRLTAPESDFLIAESRLSVRSTAAGRASLLIAVGAAGFLLLWWGRELHKTRKGGL